MKRQHMRARLLMLALVSLMVAPAQAAAEWQIKPFLGVKFGGYTTFNDLEQAAGGVPSPGADSGPDLKKVAVGVDVMLLGEVFGLEADLGHVQGYFENDASPLHGLVLKSSVTTLTGNLVVAAPRHMTRYTLRPYVVAGLGRMSVDVEDRATLFTGDSIGVVDLGGGVTGFLTKHVGVSWDVRYFRSIGGNPVTGLSFGPEQLSFWRANMALAVRF
jgi:Outer membrane protein beta-barrel domain